MLKIQIKSIFGDLLFEHESEKNTLLETLLRANLLRANLLRANLLRANLEGADLEGAKLEGADLEGANLKGANLKGAENKEFAILPQFCKWAHGIKGDLIKIGCKEKTIKEWEAFFASDLEFDTKRSTSEFKQIQAIFESYKAYMNFLAK